MNSATPGIASPVVDHNTSDRSTPNGESAGLFGWFGSLFVPDAVEQDWIRNDKDIRERARIQSSSKEIQARIANSSDMLKSADNVREYTSAPFIGGVLTAEDVGSALADSAAKAPSTLINYVGEELVDPLAKTAGKTIQSVIPWQLWAIVGAAVLLAVGIFAFSKSR